MMYKLLIIISVLTVLKQTNGSAIPMWEYLSKQEKMSYLYSMFANQIEEYCDQSSINDCSQNLLKYGLKKLKDMSEEELDKMDPYQRNANRIIWNAMMSGHQLIGLAVPKRTSTRSTTTPKPNSYEDDSYEFGASAKIENIYHLPPPNNFHPKIYRKTIDKLQINDDHFDDDQAVGHGILNGPMVVRVYPDGRPVPERQHLPQDDDLRQYQLSKIKIPGF